MESIYKKRKEDALYKLLRLAENKKANIAFELNLTPQSVKGWFSRGQISKRGAELVMKHEFFRHYFTLNELRPDVFKPNQL